MVVACAQSVKTTGAGIPDSVVSALGETHAPPRNDCQIQDAGGGAREYRAARSYGRPRAGSTSDRKRFSGYADWLGAEFCGHGWNGL